MANSMTLIIKAHALSHMTPTPYSIRDFPEINKNISKLYLITRKIKLI